MKDKEKYSLIGFLNIQDDLNYGIIQPVFKSGEVLYVQLSDFKDESIIKPISESYYSKVSKLPKGTKKVVQKNGAQCVYILKDKDTFIIGNRKILLKHITENFFNIFQNLNDYEKYRLFNFFGFSGLSDYFKRNLEKRTKSKIFQGGFQLSALQYNESKLSDFYLSAFLHFTEKLNKELGFKLEKFYITKKNEVRVGEFIVNRTTYLNHLTNSLKLIVPKKNNPHILECYLTLLKHLNYTGYDRNQLRKIISLNKKNSLPATLDLYRMILIENKIQIEEAEIYFNLSGSKDNNEKGCPIFLNVKFEDSFLFNIKKLDDGNTSERFDEISSKSSLSSNRISMEYLYQIKNDVKKFNHVKSI